MTATWASVLAYRLEPAAQRVDVLADVQHERNATLLHRHDRGKVLEERPAVLKPRPAVGHVINEEQVQTFEDPHQRRNARKLILRKSLFPGIGADPVPGAWRDADECRRVIPSEPPRS